MTDYFDAFHTISYLVLILIACALYYQLSKFKRLHTLKKLGFHISTAPSEILKKRLRNIAPAHMSNPELPAYVIASYKGLLVFWSAIYKANRGNVTCWCFRKCESNKQEPVEYWYQAIHVEGLSEQDHNFLIRDIRRKLTGLADITINERGVLMVYRRSLFKFSSTVSALHVAINHLNVRE